MENGEDNYSIRSVGIINLYHSMLIQQTTNWQYSHIFFLIFPRKYVCQLLAKVCAQHTRVLQEVLSLIGFLGFIPGIF